MNELSPASVDCGTVGGSLMPAVAGVESHQVDGRERPTGEQSENAMVNWLAQTHDSGFVRVPCTGTYWGPTLALSAQKGTEQRR